MVVEVIVTESPLDPSNLMTMIDSDGAGAVASFIGLVRASHGDEEVMGLEFEAWGSRLPTVLEEIGKKAVEEQNLKSIVIAHRIGYVEPGETIVCIHVSAIHRAQAFAACSWTIDELKRQAPIWKKEIRSSGEYWIEGLG